MSTTVTYKGNTLTTVNNETKSLLTKGTWLEDDIEITDTSSGGSSTALIVDTTDSHGGIIREITTDTEVKLQGRKTVTPTSQTQIITADTGYDGIVEVEVEGVTGLANVYQDENGVLVLDSEGNDWQRPSEWMPYASGWDDDDFDGCYFVYDLKYNTNTTLPIFYALGVSRDSGDFVVDEGYVSSNGIFTISATNTFSANTKVEGFLPIWDGITLNERYYVIKITPLTGHLTKVYFSYPSNALVQTKVSGAGASGEMGVYQPCIEIYGRLPHITGENGNFQCRYLIHVNLCDLNSLTNMYGWFRDNISLKKIDGMNTWDTKNVTNMNTLFNSTIIEDLSDIENWDVRKVTNMNKFLDTTPVKTLNLSKWTVTTALTDMSSFCRNCYALESFVLPGGNYSSASCANMFEGCRGLKKIVFNDDFAPYGSLNIFMSGVRLLKTIDTSNWDLSKVTTLRYLCNTMTLLKELDLSGMDTSSVTSLEGMCGGCSSLETIDFTNCDLSSVTNTNIYIFQNCNLLYRLKGFVYPQSFTIQYCNLMPAENLVEVLTNLPTVNSTQTITLGTTNINKLTAEQIAIATEKGWTVA